MNSALFEDIELARQSVDQAERALDRLLAKLGRAPRAQKMTISVALEDAVERLRTAREILAGLTVKES